MQKYRADTSQIQPDGAKVWWSSWFGAILAKIDNCRLATMAGDMRRTVYITGEPDTYFSQPAACRIMGAYIRGYVTGDDNGNFVFHQVYY